MKRNSFQFFLTAMVFSAVSALAGAHPGHSAFDFAAAPPHLGHEVELATVFLVLAGCFLVAVIRWFSTRRS